MNLITCLINRHLNRNSDMQRRRAERQRRAEAADPLADYVDCTGVVRRIAEREPLRKSRDVRESLGIGGRHLLGDMPFSEN